MCSSDLAGTGESVSGGITPRKRQTPGSVAFVPSVAGLILAGQVVKDICREGGEGK